MMNSIHFIYYFIFKHHSFSLLDTIVSILREVIDFFLTKLIGIIKMWSSSPVLRGSCWSHCLNWLKTLNSNPLVIVHLNISIISLNKIIVILSWEILGIKVSMPLRTHSKVLNVFTGYIKRTVGLFRSTDFRCAMKFVICWLVKERMTC